jgi:CheY-like chemotaxis protein
MGHSLAIAAKIAKGLNAKIGFKSSVGHGSLFWLKVPIAHINKFEEIKIKSFLENTNISMVKVLVVEDDQINQRLLKKMLNKLNIYPDVVSNGLEALEIQAFQKFNLIFMDINMPIMDGLEATKKIRERPEKYGNPYIVAVTANSVTIDLENSLNAGMSDYLSKPIKRDELSKLLNKILGISELPVNINKNKVTLKYYLEKTLDEFKGDEEILHSFILNFVTKVPARLDKLENAIKEHNFQTIQIEAQNLKDLVSNIYQEEMRSTLELFENYGSDKKIKNIYPLFHDLKNDFKILIDELSVQFLKKAA